MMIFNRQNLSVALMAAIAGVFSLAPSALSQDAGSPLDSAMDDLSSGANSAAAVFIEDDTVSAAAAFGEAGAAAIATDEGAVAQGTSYFGEIELENSDTDTDMDGSETEETRRGRRVLRCCSSRRWAIGTGIGYFSEAVKRARLYPSDATFVCKF